MWDAILTKIWLAGKSKELSRTNSSIYVALTKIRREWGASVECRSFASREMMMVAKSQKALGFEAAMTELETLVADMEAGKLSLEEALGAYKRGAELLAFCRTRLDDAQQQVRVLEEGVLKDFEAGQNQ